MIYSNSARFRPHYYFSILHLQYAVLSIMIYVHLHLHYTDDVRALCRAGNALGYDGTAFTTYGKTSAHETRAPVPEIWKFLEIFVRLEAEELGPCFVTVCLPGALFRFSSNGL